MNIRPYNLEKNKKGTIFRFKSKGKFEQEKIIFIQFIPPENRSTDMQNLELYNLSFGDIKEIQKTQSKIDKIEYDVSDMARTNNGDMDIVLRTVAEAARIFLEDNLNAVLMFYGSTPSRTRLYQMNLKKYYKDISKYFVILGKVRDKILKFELSSNIIYELFLVARK